LGEIPFVQVSTWALTCPVSILILQHKTMLDFTELGLDIKHKMKIYISSTHKKQTTMHCGRQTKPLILFSEFYHEDTYYNNITT